MPAAIGRPSSRNTATSMSSGSSATAFRIGAVAGFRCPHSDRFSGVISTAAAVEKAVIVTDSAVLPRA